MKKILYTLIIISVSLLDSFGQTVIGDANVDVNNAAIDNSAELKVFSSTNNKGVLFPILTSTQMNGIDSPATGLIIFNSTINEFRYYNGTDWVSLQVIESVATNSKTDMIEGETKLYTTGNVLIFLDGSNNWKQISLDTGTITP